MKEILLYPRKKNLHALMDDADYDRVKHLRWFVTDRHYHPHRVTENDEGYRFLTLHAAVIGPIPKDRVIDHINGNPLDCRRENLRICTHTQNMWNRKPHKNRKYSRYKCVRITWFIKNGHRCTRPAPWYACVKANGVTYQRGNFADEKDAYNTAVELMKRAHGEYARIQEWEGYSDNPELRKLLGRKNGPPVASRSTSRSRRRPPSEPPDKRQTKRNSSRITTIPIQRALAPHARTAKPKTTDYTGLSFISYSKRLTANGALQLIHSTLQNTNGSLFTVNRKPQTVNYFKPLAPDFNQGFADRISHSFFSLSAPTGAPEFSRGREPPEGKSPHFLKSPVRGERNL